MADLMTEVGFEKHIRELNDKSDRKLSEEDLVKSLEYTDDGCRTFYESMSKYLNHSLSWFNTREGFGYWDDLHSYLNCQGGYPVKPNSVVDSELIPNEAGGVKGDSGKIKPTLLLKSLNEQVQTVLRVLQFGANKYGDDNWKLVEKERYEDALGRHILAYYSGEKCDKDTGESHLAHAICCSLFLLNKE